MWIRSVLWLLTDWLDWDAARSYICLFRDVHCIQHVWNLPTLAYSSLKTHAYMRRSTCCGCCSCIVTITVVGQWTRLLLIFQLYLSSNVTHIDGSSAIIDFHAISFFIRWCKTHLPLLYDLWLFIFRRGLHALLLLKYILWSRFIILWGKTQSG